MINVEFTDSTETKIISVFGSPQDPSLYVNQGTVMTSDPRWQTFYTALPTSAQGSVPAPTVD